MTSPAVNPQFGGEGTLSAMIGPYSLTFFEVTGTFYAVADPSVSGTINSPIIQPVNALVSFTPRLPIGYHAFVDNYLVTPAYNALQVITMIGNPIMGTWQLNFGGQPTAVMPYDISPAALQVQLEALNTIGAGNVLVVQGINPQSYNVEFTGTLGASEILPLTATWNDLIDFNGYDCTITVATTSTGSPQITAPTSISIPPRQARIMNGILSTIDYVDTPGVQLASDSPLFALPTPYSPLIYDVAFSAATYNNGPQVLGNYAFAAPIDDTPVCITDPNLEKLAYSAPINYVWSPETEEAYELPYGVPKVGQQQRVVPMTGWRARAAQQRRRVG
jgi:hypothetical protein